MLVVLFVALPFAELAVIVASADAFGLGWTLLALVGASVLGAWLVRREGASIWRRANEELAMGRVPARQLLDGVLVLAGGALLLTPGFITDVVGLVALFPPTRALLRPVVVGVLGRRATRVVAFSSAGRRAASTAGAWRGPSGDRGFGGPASRSRSGRDTARVIDVRINDPDPTDGPHGAG